VFKKIPIEPLMGSPVDMIAGIFWRDISKPMPVSKVEVPLTNPATIAKDKAIKPPNKKLMRRY